MQKRLAYIDGLRAIAVLSVALFHARVHDVGEAHLEWWAKEGSHGVDLFFVLSGFCLAFPTLERLHATGYARFDGVSFALKRLLRILPPYAAAVILLEGVAALFASRGVTQPGGLSLLDAGGVLSNLFFLDASRDYVNRSFWSLAIEFRWYFLMPFALLLAVRNPRMFVSTIVLVALAGELTRAESTDVGVLPAFLLGIAAAYAYVTSHRIARYALPLGVASFAFAMIDEARPHFPIQTNAGWHAVAFFLVIGAGAWAPARRILSWTPLAAVGIASYSIYLLHEPIVAGLTPWLDRNVGAVAAPFAAVAAGVAAGCALWLVVERPLTEGAFVARFVASGRARMSELFRVAGVPETFEVSAPSAPARLLVAPGGRRFEVASLHEERAG